MKTVKLQGKTKKVVVKQNLAYTFEFSVIFSNHKSFDGKYYKEILRKTKK